jgi:transcription antitermination factor NusG
LADSAQWFVIWTHSNSERLVHDQLAARGFDAFLPMLRTWSRRRGAQSMIDVPMFPGYVFLRHAIDRRSHAEILKARGIVRILGARWDQLAAVPDAEVDAIRRLADAPVPVMPHAYLHEGQRVRIIAGPLDGVEGILIATKPQKGLLVVSIELLQRSVAVEVDCTQVRPAFWTAPAFSGAAAYASA